MKPASSTTKMYISEFLKDLPCHNEQNFALFNTENGIRTSSRRPPVYLPTEDIPSEQIIVTEKKNILLRYLHQQWEKKQVPLKKREHGNEAESSSGSSRSKRPRTDRGDQ